MEAPKRTRKRDAGSKILSSFLLLLTAACAPQVVDAALSCSSTAQCEETLRVGSECIDGTCTNPYHQRGCLAQRLPDWKRIRVCHSDDPPDAELSGYCRPPDPDLDYMEIRLLTQNWESAFFQSWVIQIILSEILGIPVSLESGTATDIVDFYDYESRLGYGTSYDYEALERANEVKDCRSVNRVDDQGNYTSCAHVLTEVWYGQAEQTNYLWDQGVIERPGLMGALGFQSMFIPRFTAEKDPSLLTHLGLKGEENRQKLADTFLRPTSWGEYCALVSVDNCTSTDNDATALRAPKNDEESSRYFVEDLFNGYFRKTDQNNCTLNPNSCTGHVVDYPCGWTSFLRQQFYHLNIALESDGDEPVSKGYAYSEMTEIWAAANSTKSNVMMRWWTPEALYQTFLGTDAEFQEVQLPPPTQDCVNARLGRGDRCSAGMTPAALVGHPEGMCGEPPISLQRLIVQSLSDSADDENVPVETRSPAYETIRNVQLDELQLGKIFDYWLKRNSDKYNFDPRDASCRWVVENIDFIETLVPKTYPRVIEKQENAKGALLYVALSLSLVALLSVLLATGGIVYHRKKRSVRYAQVNFLYLLLVGLFLLAVASVLMNTPKSDASCMAVNWLVLQGYTFELVPLILKVAAVLHITSAAKKFKRVKVEQKLLFTAVFALSGIWMVFLIVWTIVDPSKETADFELTEDTNADGDIIIVKSSYCHSDSQAWMLVSTAWHGVLLLGGTVLAFQTRNLRREVNESLPLAVLVYSHAIFSILRVLLYYLRDRFYVWNFAHYQSMIFSVDVIAACCIYFFPKLLASELHRPESVFNSMPIIRNISRLAPSLAESQSDRREDGDVISTQLNTEEERIMTKRREKSSVCVLAGPLSSFTNEDDSCQQFGRSSTIASLNSSGMDDDRRKVLAASLARHASDNFLLGDSSHRRKAMTKVGKNYGMSEPKSKPKNEVEIPEEAVSCLDSEIASDEAEVDDGFMDDPDTCKECAVRRRSSKANSGQASINGGAVEELSVSHWSSDNGFINQLVSNLKEEEFGFIDEVSV